ncbi:hypothetical protein CDD80_2657 [Ophiocordyceps camponoti-rufipedis]|uniref:Nephrocystin 3-like N-terminal domain-containing protein n=1 Tax=Ophiocordyceps camponoti-rufipedis TaxID=2004952 RepID=A0A2C5Z5H4_9HYPO|nr:hypothetical protein CDD80_2657 [Ophiocordyceps camponoti-rufipedis]
MADPLSMTVSLIKLAEVSGKIVCDCYKYQQGVKGALQEITQLLRETQSLRSVIDNLLLLLKSDVQAHLGTLRDIIANEGLSRFQCELVELEGRLQMPDKKWRKMGVNLLWPLKEPEVRKAVESINRMKGILDSSLIIDTTGSVLEIRRDVGHLRDDSKMQKFEQLLEGLQAHNPLSHHMELCKKRVVETGRWLLDKNDFQQWIDSKSSSFWLHGQPGCGKSVLCSAVIEGIRTRRQSTALAYYYFDFSHHGISQTAVMLRSLIYQLSV